MTRERKANQPNTKARRPGTSSTMMAANGKPVEAVPEPGQFLPVQEHHEVGQDRVGIDAARPDLAHEIHAHGIAAEREEGAVAEREDAAEAPDRDRPRGRAARKQRYLPSSGTRWSDRWSGEPGIHGEVQDRHQDGRSREQAQDRRCSERSSRSVLCHASTALPLSAKRPRGRFWMNRMMATSSTILPSTAPA